MKNKDESPNSVIAMVAPGYPAIETVRQIDVEGWEPAAIFIPVCDPDDYRQEATE